MDLVLIYTVKVWVKVSNIFESYPHPNAMIEIIRFVILRISVDRKEVFELDNGRIRFDYLDLIQVLEEARVIALVSVSISFHIFKGWINVQGKMTKRKT